jgi:hypothetical protein
MAQYLFSLLLLSCTSMFPATALRTFRPLTGTPASHYLPLLPEQQTTAKDGFSALVLPSQAQFVIPLTPRARWQWHADNIRDNAREYQMSVSVRNNGITYSFGFYVWKYPGSQPHEGDIKALVRAGQSSLFQNKDPHHNVIIKNAGVTLEPHSDRLVVKITGKENVARLFSGRSPEVTIDLVIPEVQAISKKVAVEYRDKK